MTGEPGIAPRPARWFTRLPGDVVECGLCPHHCRVPDGERGTCGVRENRGGTYYTLVHSRAVALHVDPVEKKPFFHVLPGEPAVSLAAAGCNFDCRCCQNWEIAQARPEQLRSAALPPDTVVALARKNRARLVACTYTEPVVWSEYVLDIARAGRGAGLRTLVVSNGFIEQEPLRELAPHLAAYKVDLKAFSETFYRDHCRGRLAPVLDTLRRLKALGVWTEIVVLVVPALNDTPEEARALARFVRTELGPDTPLHFTRFHPAYRMDNIPPTPVAAIDAAREAALAEGLRFVYVGNVPGHRGESTWCPGCGARLIHRVSVALVQNRLKDGACPDCGRAIPGIWA